MLQKMKKCINQTSRGFAMAFTNCWSILNIETISRFFRDHKHLSLKY